MGAMSVGVIVANKQLRGSCGGVGGDCACDLAGRPRACEPNRSQGQLAESRIPVPERASEGQLAKLPRGGTHGYSVRQRSGALPED